MTSRFLIIAALLALPIACAQPDQGFVSDIDVDTPVDDVDYDAGGVSGRICFNDESTWLAGADVYIDHDFGRAQTTTDSDGYFTLTGVPPGTWSVVVEKGSFTTTFDVDIVVDEILVLEESECLDDGEVNILVVTGLFDSIELVLDRLNIEYTLVDGINASIVNFMSDPAQLEQYDIIFFNCGMDESWIYTNQDVVGSNIADFVTNGGSIYASDWAFYIVEASHPNMVDFIGDDFDQDAPKVGVEGFYSATVRDANIASALGSGSAMLNYDLPVWVAMQGVSDSNYIMIEGTFDWSDIWGTYATHFGPLAAKMDSGNGRVLYTTFHNEAQTTSDMDVILQEIIFHL